MVKIKLDKFSLFACCIYLPPNSDPSLYASHAVCMQQLCELAGERNVVLAVGDFNLPNLCWNFDQDIGSYIPINASSEQELSLVDSVLSCGLHQINNLTNTNGKLLDLVFSSDTKRITLHEPVTSLLKLDPHHKPFMLCLEVLDDLMRTETEINAFDFRRCNYDILNTCLENINWEELLHNCDVDTAVTRFYKQLFEVFESVIPLKTSQERRSQKQPWWTPECRNLKNRVRKAKRRYLRSKTYADKQTLLDLEARLKSSCEEQFRNYIQRVEGNIKSDPKAFWTYVRERKQATGIPRNLYLNDTTSDTAADSADLFSTFFQSVQSNNRPPLLNSYLNDLPQYNINLPIAVFSVDEVMIKMQSTDTRKGPGPDSLPPGVISKCATSLAAPVCMIFNKSISEKIFPHIWKTAAITPIFKAGNVHNIENYRAISILSCLAKILESLLHDALQPSVRCVVSEYQHGFMKSRSTTSNLVSYISAITDQIENRQQVDAVYIDFAKAFDKVPHNLMVEKLNRIGFPDWLIKWIKSYLTNRSAYVKLGGVTSSCFGISSGVPQGSILGPMLFVLFINDLCTTLKSPKRMYADDLKFFRTISTTTDCVALQMDIDLLLDWCKVNGMEVNTKKCNVISFTRKTNPIQFEYKMSATNITRVRSIKDLGIIVDSKLKFTEHVSATSAKASAMLGFIWRNCQFFTDVYCLKTLYCSLVRSILEYASQVCVPYHATQVNKLERVQRSFIKFALRRLPWNNSTQLPPYEQRCRLIDLPTLKSRRTQLQRLFIFDLLKDHIDCPDLLSRVNINAPARRNRNIDFLRIPSHRTTYGYNNPMDACCRVFNTIASVFDFNISKNTFKTRIANER